jgi:dUTPase
MVLVRNVDSSPLRIFHGDAVAQAVFARVLHLGIEEGVVDETVRGAGGFGSTGG